ncbi:MAG TPA: type II secretion system protein GspM [Verrucomicrobiae bacterium]
MSNWWQNLNLTPQERKFVIGVVIVFALVLNFLFIFPQFKNWGPVNQERAEKLKTLADYEKTIAELPKIQARLAELESTNSAPVVAASDASAHYSRAVNTLAAQTGLSYNNISPPTVNLNTTNKYFQELSLKITLVGAEEKAVVNFLYRLSDGNSSVRVREFSLAPDSTKMLLRGYLTLVANYEVEKKERTASGPLANKSTNLTDKTP